MVVCIKINGFKVYTTSKPTTSPVKRLENTGLSRRFDYNNDRGRAWKNNIIKFFIFTIQ